MVSTFSHEDETDDEVILAEKSECSIYVAPTTSRLMVKRKGHSITKKFPNLLFWWIHASSSLEFRPLL